MDGSNAAFLLDDIFVSDRVPHPRGGILYIEDFDLDPSPSGRAEEATPAEPEPVYSAADVEAARAAGREEGAQLALADAQLVQMQVQSASLQSLTEGLEAARTALRAVAQDHAAELSRTVLAILQAALPATMRAHAGIEVEAMLKALMPGLICEPVLRVQAHADMADSVREALIGRLPENSCSLSVCADAALAPGDIAVAWQDGRARRDTAAIWDQVRTALAPLGLPTMEALCRGN